ATVRRLEAETPGKSRVICNQQNVAMHLNHRQTFAACRGQYIAILEGDDYWLSPQKLQKQVDFLDSHPECSLCFHQVLVFHDNDPENESLYCPPDQKEISGLEEILEMMFVPSGAVVMRTGLFTEFPSFGLDLLMGDWPFFI